MFCPQGGICLDRSVTTITERCGGELSLVNGEVCYQGMWDGSRSEDAADERRCAESVMVQDATPAWRRLDLEAEPAISLVHLEWYGVRAIAEILQRKQRPTRDVNQIRSLLSNVIRKTLLQCKTLDTAHLFTIWHPPPPYGYSYKASCAIPG